MPLELQPTESGFLRALSVGSPSFAIARLDVENYLPLPPARTPSNSKSNWPACYGNFQKGRRQKEVMPL
jgi:hypothetical protein